jgi:ComF family protein
MWSEAFRPIRRTANGVLSVLLAPPCAACAQPLETPVDSVVCDACWSRIRLLRPPFCSVCGDPLRSWRSEHPPHRCDSCRVRRPHIAAGRAIGDYDGSLRAIVHALKYEGRRSIASPLAALLRHHGHAILSGADLVVPVPLHWLRHWRRGFNQAYELAVGLGLPVATVLRRTRSTRSQTGLSASARAANVRNAFVVRPRHRIHDLCIVLVDDVSTTGATMEACARALTEGGAREVRTLTAARVATGPPPAPPH